MKVLQHERNLGYGAALKTGIRYSKNEIILMLDSDGSYPEDEIPNLLKEIAEHDMVVGARIKKDAKMPFLRKIPKYVLTKLAEYLAEEKIPDINSGLRVFKKSMYKKYVSLLPDGFSFTLTITLAALTNNDKLKFVPISYNKRKGISKIRPIHDTLNFFLLILRIILYFNPLKVFLTTAAVFLIASLAAAIYSIFVIGRLLDVTVTLLFTFAVQMVFLGLIADLINQRGKS